MTDYVECETQITALLREIAELGEEFQKAGRAILATGTPNVVDLDRVSDRASRLTDLCDKLQEARTRRTVVQRGPL